MSIQQYHILLKALVTAALKRLTLLFKQKASHKQISHEIAKWQVQAHLLGSQSAHAQLDDLLPDDSTPVRGGYHAQPPVHLEKDATLAGMLMVIRTLLVNAYRQAQISTYAANEVDSWIWVTDGPRPCPYCLKMSGTVHPIAEEFKSHPNCYCTTMPKIGTHAAMMFTV